MRSQQIETPLVRAIKKQLQEQPIPLSAFFDACLHHPQHGYYQTQSAIGRDSDFVTAPETSQVFGELIGAWSYLAWQAMGTPSKVNIVEIGPGRGVMMLDVLRVIAKVPRMRATVTVHLIETNSVLQDVQAKHLKNAEFPITWHKTLHQALAPDGDIAPEPTIILANEYLDTLAIDQFQFDGLNWYQRTVRHDGNKFILGTAAEPTKLDLPSEITTAPERGDIFEHCRGLKKLAQDILAPRSEMAPLAALFADYGHTTSGFGDTLQSVKSHEYASIFHAPGESDLTAHVDFSAFARHCRYATVAGKQTTDIDGPIVLAEFLGHLGVSERAAKLMSLNPERAGEIETSIARLMAPNGMGGRFKVCVVRGKTLPNMFPWTMENQQSRRR